MLSEVHHHREAKVGLATEGLVEVIEAQEWPVFAEEMTDQGTTPGLGGGWQQEEPGIGKGDGADKVQIQCT